MFLRPADRPRKSLMLAAFLCLSFFAEISTISAQQLDRDYLPKAHHKVMAARKALPAKAVAKKTPPKPVFFPGVQTDGQQIGNAGSSEEKPFTVTVSKTLYLPPAMYGQWSVSGTLLQTNNPELARQELKEIWELERSGDQVILSNPASGATAAVSVDSSNGNSSTFHHKAFQSKNRVAIEIPTITVDGDHMFGQCVEKFLIFKNDILLREYYAVYRLDAQRIGAARTRFRADQPDGGNEPDIEIEDVKPAGKHPRR